MLVPFLSHFAAEISVPKGRVGRLETFVACGNPRHSHTIHSHTHNKYHPICLPLLLTVLVSAGQTNRANEMPIC